MADNIGALVNTKIPPLGSEADIQDALRMYHYGSDTYNSGNAIKGNLPDIGIARYITDLQDSVATLQAASGIQESIITAQGDLLVGLQNDDVGILSLPTTPSPQGYVLTVDTTTETALKWSAVEVTASNSAVLSNKTLTLPRIASGGGITDNSIDFRRYITFTTVASGVNHIGITNSIISAGPTISAIGDGENIDLNLSAKGTGKVKIGGSEVVTLAGSQVLTNKELTSPIISTISNTGTLTLPTSTDTLIGRATTDTLTNKTLTAESVDFVTTTGTNRKFKFVVPTISDGTTVLLTVPSATSVLATTATSQTIDNKILANNNTVSIGTDLTNSNAVTTNLLTAFNNKANLSGATFTGQVNVQNNAGIRNTGLFIGTARIYVGSTTPSGASPGDVWIRTS